MTDQNDTAPDRSRFQTRQRREQPRRLFRAREGRVIGGVCAGVAAYFKIDPVIVRVVAVASTFFGGIGILLYLAALLLVPDEQGKIAADASSFRGKLLIGVAGVLLFVAVASAVPWGSGDWFLPGFLFPLAFLALLGGGVWWLVQGADGSRGEAGGVLRAILLAFLLLCACALLALGSAWASAVGGDAVVAGLVIAAGALLVAGRLRRPRALADPAGAGDRAAARAGLRRGHRGRRQHRRARVPARQRRSTCATATSSAWASWWSTCATRTCLRATIGWSWSSASATRCCSSTDDVCVASEAEVGLGAVDVFDQDNGGADVDWEDRREAPSGTPRVIVDADVGIGAFEVDHERPEHWRDGDWPRRRQRRPARAQQLRGRPCVSRTPSRWSRAWRSPPSAWCCCSTAPTPSTCASARSPRSPARWSGRSCSRAASAGAAEASSTAWQPRSARIAATRHQPTGCSAGSAPASAAAIGLDPLILRVAFVAAARRRRRHPRLPDRLGGAAGRRRQRPRRAAAARPRRRSRWRSASGCWCSPGMLAMRELGIWFSDAVAWPLVLVAAGGALLWRQLFAGSREDARGRTRRRARCCDRAHARPAEARWSADAEAARPADGDPLADASRPRATSRPRSLAEGPRRRATCPRASGRPPSRASGIGVALVIAAGLDLPAGHGRAQRGARRAARGARGRRRARRDPRPADPAAGALADRGARAANPLAGARRGRRAPARLGAADARDGAAARARAGRGRAARAPPGARAARVAGRPPRARAGRHARRGARGGGRRGRGAPRRAGRGRRPSASASSTTTPTPWSPPRGRR